MALRCVLWLTALCGMAIAALRCHGPYPAGVGVVGAISVSYPSMPAMAALVTPVQRRETETSRDSIDTASWPHADADANEHTRTGWLLLIIVTGLGLLLIALITTLWFPRSPRPLPVTPLVRDVEAERRPTPTDAALAPLRRLPLFQAPAAVRGVTPLSPLAGALLECYAAVPYWPASATPHASAHGATTLLEHVLGVRVQAMALTIQYGLPAMLAELAALGHDLGKLAAYQQNRDGQWTRISAAHDQLSATLIASLREWELLDGDDQADLTMAIAFHHRPNKCPFTATPRAMALLRLLLEADRFATIRESTAPRKNADGK